MPVIRAVTVDKVIDGKDYRGGSAFLFSGGILPWNPMENISC